MKKLTVAGLRTPEEYEEAVKNRLVVLRDTFGENDHRVRAVEARVAEMTADNTPANWHITALYCAWATQYPGDITHDPNYPCSCGDGRGWVFEYDEMGRTTEARPCSRCNQKAFEFLYEQGNREVVRSGGYGEEPPVPDQPPWDDL